MKTIIRLSFIFLLVSSAFAQGGGITYGGGGAQGDTFFKSGRPWYDVSAFGAVADSKIGYNCNFTAATHVLVCQDLTFVAGDVGKTIHVYGANNTANFTAMRTTISAFTSGTTVTLTTCANTTGCATGSEEDALITWVQVQGPTNNATAIQAAITAACTASTNENPSTVFFPNGVYGFGTALQVNCGNITLTSPGHAVLMGTTLTLNTGAAGDGQGMQMLQIGAGMPGRSFASATITITAGTNQLVCPTAVCALTAADVGVPMHLDYGNYSQQPLWTTIISLASCPGAGCTATLRDNAQTTMPFPLPGTFFLPQVLIGFTLLQNIDIGFLNFQNLGYRAASNDPPGLPLVSFGTDNQSMKQGLHFHDNVIMGLGGQPGTNNNGALDQAWIERNRFLGLWDSMIYLPGVVSNVHVSYNDFACDTFPWSQSAGVLPNGILTKNHTHTFIDNNTFHCKILNQVIGVADWPHFDMTIGPNNKINEQGGGAVGIQLAIGQRTKILDNDIQDTTGNAIRVFGNTVVNTLIKGNRVTSGIKIDDAATGDGPSNTTVAENDLNVPNVNALTVTKAEGINYFRGNRLINSPIGASAAYTLSAGNAGALNLFSCDNFQTGFTGFSDTLINGAGISVVQACSLSHQTWRSTSPPLIYGLVKQTAVGNTVAPITAAVTQPILGVAVDANGQGAATGMSTIVKSGTVPMMVDGATTAGNFAQASAVLAATAHDTASAAIPAANPILGTFASTVAGVPVLTTSGAGIVCNAASPVVCTVTTNGAVHGLLVKEPFTITGTTQVVATLPAQFTGIVQTVLSTTSFTFCVGGGLDANGVYCQSTGMTASATGNSGNIFPPAYVNFNPVMR